MLTARSWPGRVRITTTNLDEAHAWNRTHYVEHRTQLLESPDKFLLAHALTDCGAFSVARVETSAALRVSTDPTDYVAVCEVVRGRHYAQFGHYTVTTAEAALALLPAGAPLVREWSGGTVRRLVRLPVTAVATVLGCDPQAIIYEGIAPCSLVAGLGWMSLSRHVTRCVLPTNPTAVNGLLLDATARLLVATLLNTFPIVSPIQVPSVWGAPAVVVRAKRWIDDNAHRPIGVPEIAAAVRVSPSWLGDAFRQCSDTTPMRYVRRVRLDGAHQDLKLADPTLGDTVGEIATRWGFGHLQKFAKQYRRAYGCRPVDTLRS